MRDVANAHLLSANAEKELPLVMNVGTGKGASVRQVILRVLEAKGRSDLKVDDRERRLGDPAYLSADVNRIQGTLRISAEYELIESIKSLV